MVRKTKTIKKASDKLAEVAQHCGIMLMTLAATAGMLELPNHPNSRIVVPIQPTFAMNNEDNELNNPIRRENQETDQHYISYSVAQRTPSRSSKH